MDRFLLIFLMFVSSIVLGQTNVSYGEHEQQELDIYFPTEWDENTPVVMNIHGGAWQATHRQRAFYRSFVVDLFNSSDNILVNIDYRLLVEGTSTYVFPNQIEDVVSAIEFIRESYGLQTNPLYTMGNSAGGHLALWTYLNGLGGIDGVIFITSPYNGGILESNGLTYFEDSLIPWVREQMVAPSLLIPDDELVRYISPSTYANPNLDNIMAIFANNDSEVPRHQKLAMQQDYPNITYHDLDTWHSGFLGEPHRSNTIGYINEFIDREALSIDEFIQSQEPIKTIYYTIEGTKVCEGGTLTCYKRLKTGLYIVQAYYEEGKVMFSRILKK